MSGACITCGHPLHTKLSTRRDIQSLMQPADRRQERTMYRSTKSRKD